MARAGQAGAFLQEDDDLSALEGLADLVPLGRCAQGDDPLDDQRLQLLARVRAEQLMSARLLNLLARCAGLDLLLDPEGEAAVLLDAQQRISAQYALLVNAG